MDRLDSREAALSIGIALLALGIAVSAALHDSAIAGVLAVGGCGLILYSVIWDRLAEFGPGGIKLFEKIKKQLAERVDDSRAVAAHPEVAEGSGEAGPPSGQAAAAIRAAKTPEELVEVLVKIVDRPESAAERRERVRRDTVEQRRQESYRSRS